jgi:hypothetical protein
MPGMPYHLEKGPLMSVLEDLLHKPSPVVENLLARLRDNTIPMVEVGGVDSSNLNVAPYPTVADREWHIEHDWFGYQAPGQPQAGFNLQTNPTTGFWESYYGDVEAIVRLTFIRAIEVSLGLVHDAEPPGTRHWPIQLFWKCPNPWFEGWVSWRHEPAHPAQGVVTVILATPGNGAQVLPDPRTGRSPGIDPTAATTDEGMWIVTHAGHTPWVVPTTTPTTSGVIPLPSLGCLWQGNPGLTTVAPSFGDGGVTGSGFPYVPPTPTPPTNA